MNMSKRELLLCGSGLPAFAHIGVLKALAECKVSIGTVTGSSTGSLIAALHSNGISSSVIQDLFLNRYPKRFNTADWLGVRDGCQATKRMYCPVVDLEPVAARFVQENGLKPLANLRIIAWDLLSQQPVVFSGNNYSLAQALAASCAVPGISRPVRTGGHLLVDIAAREWQPEQHCGQQAIISRAAYSEDQAGLSQLDRWLKQRRQLLHVAECASVGCDDTEHVVVTTNVTANGCACAEDEAAKTAVIAAGLTAARAQFA